MKYTERDIIGEPSREILVSSTACINREGTLLHMVPERKHNYFFLEKFDSNWQVVMLTSAGILRGIDIPKHDTCSGENSVLGFVNELMKQYEAIPYNKENGIRSYYSPCVLTAQDVLKIQNVNEPVNWYKLKDGVLVEMNETAFLALLSEEQRKHYYELRLGDFVNRLYRVSDADGSEVIAIVAKVLWYYTNEGQREYYASGVEALNDFVETVRISDEYSRMDDAVGVRIDGVCIDLLKYLDGQYCLVPDFLSIEKLRDNYNLGSFVSSLFRFDMVDSVLVTDGAVDGSPVITIPANEWDNVYSVKGIPGYDDDGFFSSIFDEFSAFKYEHYYMVHCKNHITGYVIVYDGNYRAVLECETYSRKAMREAFKEKGVEELLTECPEKINAFDLAERIRQSGCRKPVDSVALETIPDATREEEYEEVVKNLIAEGEHKIAVFEVLEDIERPDFVGGDSYEYCVKHNLFHKAFSKGDLVYGALDEVLDTFQVENEEELRQQLGDYSRYSSMRTFLKKNFKDVYEARLKDGCMADKKQKKLSETSTLYDVWSEIRHRGYSSPMSKSVSFIGCIDGDMLFNDFVHNVHRN